MPKTPVRYRSVKSDKFSDITTRDWLVGQLLPSLLVDKNIPQYEDTYQIYINGKIDRAFEIADIVIKKMEKENV
jgi:hypothetical protein